MKLLIDVIVLCQGYIEDKFVNLEMFIFAEEDFTKAKEYKGPVRKLRKKDVKVDGNSEKAVEVMEKLLYEK